LKKIETKPKNRRKSSWCQERKKNRSNFSFKT
jgi:hypothetical protein